MCRVYLYLLVVLGVVVAGCKDGNVHYVDFAYSSEFATPLLVAAADHLFDFTNEYTDDDTGQTCTRLYVYRPVDFASDASVTARLDDKSLEIGTISSIAFSAAVGREVDIAGVSISHIDGESNGLVMRDFFLNPSKLSVHTSDSGPPSSPVARRKIATVPFSCSSFQLSAFIELFSLDDDIDVLFMESNAIEDAWNNGDIDGAFVHGKTFEFLQSQGGHVIITAKRMSDW